MDKLKIFLSVLTILKCLPLSVHYKNNKKQFKFFAKIVFEVENLLPFLMWRKWLFLQ